MELPDLLRPPELPDDASRATRAMLRTLVILERSGLFLLVVGFFGILIMATDARDRARVATNYNPNFPGGMAATNAVGAVRYVNGRAIFPYSVIPGGVQSSDDLLTAVYSDPVVGQHYSDFDLQHVKFFTIDHDAYFYVSYRIPAGVFWSKTRIRIHRGEHLLTDGTLIARTRCGNRLATLPMLPVSNYQPAVVELEFPGELTAPPAPFTPTVAHIVPAVPGTPFFLIPPPFIPPGNSPPFIPPVFFAANPPAGALVFFLSIVIWLLIRSLLRRSLISS
jgi:hypothetical protein